MKKNKKINKPFRNTKGNSKFSVFVKDPKTGNIKKVNFGDPNMEIKRDDPKRRKSFRARHNCDNAKDKTTPRYWSCKFWSNKNVSDLLKEIVDPYRNFVDLDEDIKEKDVEKLNIKNELSTEIWESDEKLKNDVRIALLKNAKEFIKFCNIDKLKYKDIILTGSMANYNWTEHSDLDVHIIIDFNQISEDDDFINDYFRTKKSLWSERMPIKVKNHDVEMYIQNLHEEHTSTGVYSLIKNKWITKPIKTMIGIDANNIKKKASYLMDMIDDLEDYNNTISSVDIIDKLFNKIKLMRKCGLEKEGEFSTENLVFKVLRNTGYLKKLMDMKKEILTKELTLENISMYTSGTFKGNIKEANIGNVIKKAKNAGILTIGLIVGLLAADISAQEIQRAGVPNELIQKAIQFFKSSDMNNKLDNIKY